MALQDCLDDLTTALTGGAITVINDFLNDSGLGLVLTQANDLLVSIQGTITLIDNLISLKNTELTNVDNLLSEIDAFFVIDAGCAADPTMADLRTKVAASSTALTNEIANLTLGKTSKQAEETVAIATKATAQTAFDDMAAVRTHFDS